MKTRFFARAQFHWGCGDTTEEAEEMFVEHGGDLTVLRWEDANRAMTRVETDEGIVPYIEADGVLAVMQEPDMPRGSSVNHTHYEYLLWNGEVWEVKQ